MPYNLTLDIPVNRDVARRLREMDEWIDMNPQYVATNIQPDHFPNRMLVGGVMPREYLQSGTNNRNTPYHFPETMSTASAGKLTLKKAVKGVGKVVKPVAKFTYNEILKPVALELKKEGVSVAKDMLKEAIKTALTGDSAGMPPSYEQSLSHHSAPPSYEESFSHPSYYGYGRKPKGSGRKPRTKGGNVYPSASSVHGNQKWAGKEGNIAAVIGGTPVLMDLPTDVKKGKGISGGKFNLKKALSSSSKDVGHWVKEDYAPFMAKHVAPVAKQVGVELGRELLPVAFEAVGTEFGVPPVVSGVVGKVITDRLLSEKNTGVKGGRRKPIYDLEGAGRKERNEIVKKVMEEKGLKMIEASKYVKEHGLYTPDVKKKRAKSKTGGREKRAEIVKKVMEEKGLKMIEASKYVKEHGLY